MMDNKTKFQKLSSSFRNKFKKPIVYDKNAVVYKTDNKQDYEKTKLELQQQSYLYKQFKVVANAIENRSLMYSTTRYPSYVDYDLMDTYPIISGALRLLAEEACTPDDSGKILNIKSNSERVRRELTHLFYTTLNINSNLLMWIKGMVKYGDNFVYLQMDRDLGVTGARQLPNIEVERHEGKNRTMQNYLASNEDDTYFTWVAESQAEFKYWQIAHFRLLEDDRRLPYGLSVLEPARRTWKNLILVEDAMRTIRLFRAMDRRVIYLDVGNIDNKDVPAYVEDVGNKFKRKRAVDPETGQEDIKFNVMGNDQDFVIPVRGQNDNTKIDTLSGSSNLSEIADIEYELNQLFAALGIPKPFLQYSDAAGEGKNLAMLDVRFARKVNRIQLSALQELNKIAIIHLHLIGLDDELNNFELSMNSPSVQAETLRIEQMASKISAFKDAVSDAGKGIAAMSFTMAWQKIFKMNDDEISLNMEQQYMESAASKEIESSPERIETRLFDRILALYGKDTIGQIDSEEGGEDSEEGGFSGGGGGGGGLGMLGDTGGDLGGDLGDEDLGGEDLGGEGGEDLADLDLDGEPSGESEEPSSEKLGENYTPITINNGFDLGKISEIIRKTKK